MKILFVGDYSNFHATLARALRRMGHDTTVISSGSRCMDTSRDIDLQRVAGKWGAVKYLYKIYRLLPRLSGYDVVQLINPNFFELKPDKIRWLFDRLRRQNRYVSLSLTGNDPFYVQACCEGRDFRYTEYRIGDERAPFAIQNPRNEIDWTTDAMLRHCWYVYDHIDGAVSCLYEYHRVGERFLGDKLRYIGIPIDVDAIEYTPLIVADKVNIFVGVKTEMMTFKGTDRLLATARRVEADYSHLCRVLLVEDKPYNEYMRLLKSAHIVLDQLYSYTPATNALGAMAMGKVVVSGAEPEYYDFIGERELRPIVNVLPDDEDIYNRLVSLVTSPQLLARLSASGRELVVKHNAASLVAERYLSHLPFNH